LGPLGKTTPTAPMDTHDEAQPSPMARVPEKKRGRPQGHKKPAKTITSDTDVTVDADSKPKKPTITYYLTMYLNAQMQKAEKQRKSINKFLALSPELEFDIIKAQVLEKISESLKPKTIAFEHYSINKLYPCILGGYMR
ncbi:hypothetical protein K503DRAFT_788331, partial [Rhizopogon vinicolor AM-OR11-026]